MPALIPVRDDRGRRGPTIVTTGIIGIWIVAYIAAVQSTPAEYQAFQHHFGLDIDGWNERFSTMGHASGLAKLWHLGALIVPLITYKLLHAGPIHLFANVFTFWVFGGRIEARAGWFRFLLFHELVGVAVAAAELWQGARSGVVLGASGTVAGSITAYLCLHFQSRVRVMFPLLVWPVFFDIPAVVVVLCWCGLQIPNVVRLLQFDQARPVAWIGFLAGAVSAFALLPLITVGRTPSKKAAR